MSGALIGAAAGGPPGAVIGAALGIFVGDGWITKREYRDIEAAWISLQLEADERGPSSPVCSGKTGGTG